MIQFMRSTEPAWFCKSAKKAIMWKYSFIWWYETTESFRRCPLSSHRRDYCFLLPSKSIASQYQECMVTFMREYSATKSDFLCTCFENNWPRMRNERIMAKYCFEQYWDATRQSRPSHPLPRRGSYDICSGTHGALVRASGLDWCNPWHSATAALYFWQWTVQPDSIKFN